MTGSKPRRAPDASLGAVFLRFLRLGALAWGGPAAQIAMIRDDVAERAGWITRDEFNRALAVYQVLPGPEATEMCVYLGVRRAGRLGGLVAGLGFVAPGLVLMLALAWAYVAVGIDGPAAAGALGAMQACVAAMIVRAVHRIGSHGAHDPGRMALAGAVCAADLLGASFALTLPLAGLGWARAGRGRAGAALAVACAAAILALALVWHALADSHGGGDAREPAVAHSEPTPAALGLSGLRAGLLTFGGAYTVIPFLEHDAVDRFGWLDRGQVLDGVACSGVLPAPLVIVATFVGFVSGGWAGALAMTLGVFLPAFAFTIVGHALFERIVSRPGVHAVLDGVTAGVVGMIAALGVRATATGVHDVATSAVFLGSLLVLVLVRARWSVPLVVVAAGAFGAIRGLGGAGG